MTQWLGDTLDDEHADLLYREYDEGRREGFRSGVCVTLAWVFLIAVCGIVGYGLWG